MRKIDRITAQQHGVIARSQAKEAGLSEKQIRTLITNGVWVRTRTGVYRIAGMRATWHTRVASAVAGRTAVASFRTAAVLTGLGVWKEPRPEITVPHGQRASLSGQGTTHVSRQWDLRDETIRFGIPCTGVERTILDCAATTTASRLERLAESAIRQELTSWLKLAESLSLHSAHGRDGCGPLRALVKRRIGDGTVTLSDFGRLVVQLLVDAGLEPPVVEHRVAAADGTHIIALDLAWPSRKLAWELDGLEWHFGRLDTERDKRKRNQAKLEGWRIQEILWSMYLDEPEDLVAMARAFLAS